MSILFQCGNTTEGGGSSEPKIIPKQCPRFLKFSCFAKNMKILEVHRRPLPTPNSVIQDSDASNLKYRISNNNLCYILSGLKLDCELKSSISTNQCFVQDLKCVLYPLTAGRATDMPLPTAIIVGDHAGPTSSSVTPLKYHIMRLFPCYSGQAARRER